MKKLISMIMIFCFMMALCACKKTNDTQVDEQVTTHSHTHAEDVSGTTDVDVSQNEETKTEEEVQGGVVATQGSLEKVDTEGVYKTKHINKIDVPCAEEISKAQSDASKTVIYDNYAQEWEDVAQRYYKELLKCKGSVPATVNYNTAEQMHEFLKQYMSEWEVTFENQRNLYTSMMNEGADNTPVELMRAQVGYESKRELALYFIGVYEDLESFSNQGY